MKIIKDELFSDNFQIRYYVYYKKPKKYKNKEFEQKEVLLTNCDDFITKQEFYETKTKYYENNKTN